MERQGRIAFSGGLKGISMAQKVIKVVGTSKESFAKAAANAVAEAAKTVRNLKWARVCGLEMELDGQNITQYRTTTNIYLDVED
jgi:dodecin